MKRQLLITEKVGARLWRVKEKHGNVDKNFFTDYASVPRLLWNVVAPATGYHAELTVDHDWDYSLDSGFGITRKQADKKLLINSIKNMQWPEYKKPEITDSVIKNYINKTKNGIIFSFEYTNKLRYNAHMCFVYAAVRVFGGFSFKKKYCKEKLHSAYPEIREKLISEFKPLIPSYK